MACIVGEAALGESIEFTILSWDGEQCAYDMDGVTKRQGYLKEGQNVYLSAGQGSVRLEDTTLRPPQLADGAGSGEAQSAHGRCRGDDYR